MFPVTFSFYLSESAKSFIFFFESLRAKFFDNDIPKPAVVLLDLAAGMISAFDTHKAMPYSQLQFCTWHVVKAMKERFQRAGRYAQDEIKDYRDDADIEYDGLINYI